MNSEKTEEITIPIPNCDREGENKDKFICQICKGWFPKEEYFDHINSQDHKMIQQNDLAYAKIDDLIKETNLKNNQKESSPKLSS